ncbi:MAG: galactose-1-phosphate uridylyltransferase [Vulcanimicrobiaceae bacterium]
MLDPSISRIVEDPIGGDIALIARSRRTRPDEFRNPVGEPCPFCPGHESRTPPSIVTVDAADGRWLARVFRNKFPAVEPPDGDHEVIVDAPDHTDEITLPGVILWRERFRAALDRYARAMPVLFKNRGEYAGATIRHPHTQLVALARAIPRWERIRSHAAEHLERTGNCVWCEDASEAGVQDRLVSGLTNIVGFVPRHSRFGMVLRFAPTRCTAAFSDASDAELADLTTLVRQAVPGLGGLAFNLFFEGDPHGGAGVSHWHADLVPRANTLAGFELASDLHISSGTAQESAARWRRMSR